MREAAACLAPLHSVVGNDVRDHRHVPKQQYCTSGKGIELAGATRRRHRPHPPGMPPPLAQQANIGGPGHGWLAGGLNASVAGPSCDCSFSAVAWRAMLDTRRAMASPPACCCNVCHAATAGASPVHGMFTYRKGGRKLKRRKGTARPLALPHSMESARPRIVLAHSCQSHAFAAQCGAV